MGYKNDWVFEQWEKMQYKKFKRTFFLKPLPPIWNRLQMKDYITRVWGKESLLTFKVLVLYLSMFVMIKIIALFSIKPWFNNNKLRNNKMKLKSIFINFVFPLVHWPFWANGIAVFALGHLETSLLLPLLVKTFKRERTFMNG